MKTKTSARPATRHTLSDQFRDVIRSRGLTAYGLGHSAGVDAGVIQRWLNGERDIRFDTADRLAAALGLRLVEVAGRGKGRPRRAGSAVASGPPPARDTGGDPVPPADEAGDLGPGDEGGEFSDPDLGAVQ